MSDRLNARSCALRLRRDRRVFSKLPNNDLKLDYGDGTGVNVHFKGFEE